MKRARKIRGGLIAGLIMTVLVTAIAATSATAAGQEAKVTPSVELVNEQFVRVDWSGFGSEGLVYLRQCTAAPTTFSQCSDSLVNGTSRSDGSGTVYFQVREGEHPEGNFTCDFDSSCSIGLFTETDDFASATFAAIDFAFPTTACPTPQGASVAGSGAAAANRAMLRWAGIVCREPYTLPVQYTLKNSVDGLRDVVVGLTDFGVSSLPFEKGDLDTLEKDGRTFAFVPMSATSLVFGYRLYDRQSGERIIDLKLTPELLAEIFTGQILNWNDERIIELNPGYKFPAQLKAIGRADHSAVTYLLTSWFDTIAKPSYQAGGDAYSGGPTATYPSTGDVDLRTGAPAVALEVAQPAVDKDSSVYGQIGWMDASYAATYGLPTVQLKTASGEFVSATTAAVAAGIERMVEGEQGLLRPDFSVADPGVYPIPIVDYAVVPTNKFDGAQGRVLKGFLEYALTDGQEGQPEGYVPLPAALASEGVKGAADIPTKLASATAPEEGISAPGDSSGGVAPLGSGFGGGLPDLAGPGAPGADATADEELLVGEADATEYIAARALSGSDSRWVLPVIAMTAVALLLMGSVMFTVASVGAWGRSMKQGFTWLRQLRR